MGILSDLDQETSLEELVQQIRELAKLSVGQLVAVEGAGLSSALANLDLLLANRHQQGGPVGEGKLAGSLMPPKPLASIRDILESVDIQFSPKQQAQLHLSIGREHRRLGLWAEALDEYQEALYVLREAEAPRVEADCHREMGHIYSEQSIWEAASTAYELASSLYDQLGDDASVGEIMKDLAINCFQMGDYDQAVDYATRVLIVADKLGDLRLQADLHNLLAAVHDVRSEFGQALTYYQRSLLFYEQVDDPKGLAQTYHNLGLTYTKVQDWQSAGDAYERCLLLAKEYGNQQILGSVCLNRASLYFHLHDSIMAKAYCQEAIRIFEGLQLRRGLGNAYKLLAMLSSREKRHDDAGRFFRVATRICRDIQDVQTLAETCEEWAKLKQQRGSMEDARQLLDESKRLYAQLQATDSVERVEEALNTLSA